MATNDVVHFGKVPAPKQLTRAIIDKPYAWDNLGERQIKAVVLHRTLGGELMTTERYFADPNQDGYRRALTDFGVAAAGYAHQWNELTGYRTPWASGPYLAGGYDGIQFVTAYGINAVNRDCAAIELEGLTYDTPVSDAQLQTTIELIAWVMDRYVALPWNVWPRRPDGVAAVLYHWELCGRGYKLCPGEAVEALIQPIIGGVQSRLKLYQTHSAPTPTWFDPHPSSLAQRSLPPKIEHKAQVINGARWWDISDRRVTISAELAPGLKYATDKAPPVRTPMARGFVFEARSVVEGDDVGGSRLWWVTKSGTRIPMSMTSPRLDLEALKTA